MPKFDPEDDQIEDQGLLEKHVWMKEAEDRAHLQGWGQRSQVRPSRGGALMSGAIGESSTGLNESGIDPADRENLSKQPNQSFAEHDNIPVDYTIPRKTERSPNIPGHENIPNWFGRNKPAEHTSVPPEEDNSEGQSKRKGKERAKD